jgi:OOP family OmpA-OmpF porin
MDELKKLADLMIRKPEYKLVVAGHTDNVGNKDFNMKLSLERANAVRTKLMQYGVPSERIVTEGYGDTMPIAPNTTPEGRALNRRVELKLLRF